MTAKKLENNQDSQKASFIIKIEGDEQLESFRILILNHIKDEKFDHIYILTDEVSKSIAEKLYPNIYILENLLRKYLTLFFTTTLGPKWWNDIADEKFGEKVSKRKNNETFFSKRTIKNNGKDSVEDLVDLKSFLIDFDNLGEIIYKISAGNLKMLDIQKNIEKLDEGDLDTLPNEVKGLKAQIKANIKRFFPEFETIHFQKKWEFLYNIRNKVAHNSLLNNEDETKANEYIEELTKFLQDQNNNLDQLRFDLEEIAMYQNTIVKQSSKYDKISKGKLSYELNKTNEWAKKTKLSFIGYQLFIGDILGIKGYDLETSAGILYELQNEGYINIYNYIDPTGQRQTQPLAIKVLKPLDELFNNQE